MRWRLFLGSLACAAISLTASTVEANGRYPHSQKVVEVPDQSNRIYVRTTFGLLESADAGASWYHVCERVIFGVRVNYDLDALLEVARDGTLLSGSWHGVRVSRDAACTWQTESALPVDPVFFAGASRNDRGSVVDLTRSVQGNLYALVTMNNAAGNPDHHAILISRDDAQTWGPTGNPIPTSAVDQTLTLELAPDDETQIYVSGRKTDRGAVLSVSMDGGETWEHREMGPGVAPEVYLLPPSAILPNVLFARGRVRTATDGIRDELYHSTDRGGSWHALLSLQAALLGFAVSLDGKVVLAAYGETGYVQDGPNRADLGIYRSSMASFAFEKIFDGNVTCLDWYPRGLYACSGKIGDAFQLGLAADANFGLGDNPFRPLLRLPEISGPLPWNAPAPAGLDCADDWRVIDPSTNQVVGGICQKLGACRDGAPDGTGPPGCSADGGGSVLQDGTGGAGQAGTAGSGGAAGIGAATGSGGESGQESKGAAPRVGCGCHIGERAGSFRSGGVALVCLGCFLLRRLRRPSDEPWIRVAS